MVETLTLNQKFNDYSLKLKIGHHPFYILTLQKVKKIQTHHTHFFFKILLSRNTETVCNREKATLQHEILV